MKDGEKWIKEEVETSKEEKPRQKKRVRSLVEKSDAMRQHEKWTEETLKRKPKHTREGLPIQPWHGLAFLGALFAMMVLIGYLLYR